MNSRRHFLVGSLGAAVVAGSALRTAAAAEPLPRTGPSVRELSPFDDQVLGYMRKHRIVGGAVAVVREGRLLLARGYGHADREARTPVQPTSLFRVASVSKPLTGMAVLAAIEDGVGQLSLDTVAFPYLGLEPFLKNGDILDPRLMRITVEQLLHHSGGWDRSRSGDLMFQHFHAARDLGIPSPPDHRSLIRWAMGRPLDFDPGSRYAYSNFGYCVLGRVLEKATGKGYEEYVRSRLLIPMGAPKMRIGRARRQEKLPAEVSYYDAEDRKGRNIHSGDPEREVPLPYTLSPALMDAHGGWVASAVDLARVVTKLDYPGDRPVLKASSLQQLFGPPPAPLARASDGRLEDVYYGCGWQVRRAARGINYWHVGGMDGTTSILVRLATGLSWAAVFNTRAPGGELDGILHEAAGAVTTWPRHDLFSEFS